MGFFTAARGVRYSTAKARGRRGYADINRCEYRKRDKTLFAMGFRNYSAYLKSALWAGIRQRVLLTRKTCEVCNGYAGTVHHLSYSKRVLSGECDRLLVAICEDCHHRCEFTPDGVKRSFVKSVDKTKQLLKGSGAWDKYHGRPSG